MNKESIIEEISNYKDMRRNLWASVVLLSGLIYKISHFTFNATSYIDLLLFMSGLLLNYFFISCIASFNQEIKKLILILRKGE